LGAVASLKFLAIENMSVACLLRLSGQSELMSTTAYLERLAGTVGINITTLFGYVDILLLFYHPPESFLLT